VLRAHPAGHCRARYAPSAAGWMPARAEAWIPVAAAPCRKVPLTSSASCKRRLAPGRRRASAHGRQVPVRYFGRRASGPAQPFTGPPRACRCARHRDVQPSLARRHGPAAPPAGRRGGRAARPWHGLPPAAPGAVPGRPRDHRPLGRTIRRRDAPAPGEWLAARRGARRSSSRSKALIVDASSAIRLGAPPIPACRQPHAEGERGRVGVTHRRVGCGGGDAKPVGPPLVPESRRVRCCRRQQGTRALRLGPQEGEASSGGRGWWGGISSRGDGPLRTPDSWRAPSCPGESIARGRLKGGSRPD
jgi:hypothetical protein